MRKRKGYLFYEWSEKGGFLINYMPLAASQHGVKMKFMAGIARALNPCPASVFPPQAKDGSQVGSGPLLKAA
jgi:hypothetical protein